MNVLLDTHAFLWLISADARLSRKAVDVFLDKKTNLFLSIASYWEICVKISLGKLELRSDWPEKIEKEINVNRIQLLPIKPDHCIKTTNLLFSHRDPFDRMIIAQAISEKFQVMTNNKSFADYPISIIW